MKDPADSLTLELPHLGIVALPDWLLPAMEECPNEARPFAARLNELQDLERFVSTEAFATAYAAMLEARDRLYDAWIDRQPDDDEACGGA